MTYEEITREMIEALTDEITAIKEDGAGQQIPLQGGIRKGQYAGRLLYTFVLTYELASLDDTPAQLKVGNQRYEVTVVAVQGFEVTIATSVDLGERVPAASLNVAPYYLLELLKRRLEEIREGKLKADKAMALRLFHEQPNEKVPFGGTVRVSPNAAEPNVGQRQALERTLGQRITFIWGPPGTGKTTTISHIVPNLVTKGERVFITSHTNVAVDAVLKAAIKGFSQKELEEGAVIRVGIPKEPDSQLSYVLLDAVVERRSKGLQQQKALLEIKLQKAKQEYAQWQWWSQELRKVAALEDQLAEARKALGAAAASKRELKARVEAGRREIVALRSRLAEARSAGFWQRLLGGLNPERIAVQLDARQAQVTALEAQLGAADSNLIDRRRKVTELDNGLEAARAVYIRTAAHVPTSAEVATALERGSQEMQGLERELAQLKAQLEAVAATVIREAKVIGATLTKLTTTADLHRTTYDAVIVDEASMIPQPHLWFAGSLATTRIVVLGDFRQLPPISLAEGKPAAQKRMATDLYKAARILDEAGRLVKDDRLVALQEQFRMHEQIGELANELVYIADGNPLKHKATLSVVEGLGADPYSGTPLILCDTSTANPWCAHPDGSYTRYNIYTALVAARIAQQVVKSHPNVEVGIMAPYAAQSRLIQTVIKQYQLSNQVQVATVHRFQGNEKDVIIVDLVDGPPFKPGLPLQNEKGQRLLNVAFTRARGKLILISNTDFFAGRQGGDALEVAHTYFGRHAKAMDSRTVVAGYGDDEIISVDAQLRRWIDLGSIGAFNVFSESTFYDAFLADLGKAEHQVIIFSPFVHVGRTSQLIPALRHLLERGVSVQVLTRTERSAEESEKAKMLRALESLGIKITSRNGLHEKLAFIDEGIAWAGSLNMLSQRNSTEFMMRIATPEAVSRLREFSGVGNLLRQQQRREQRQQLVEQLAAVVAKYMSVPLCPVCKRPMVLRMGQYGPFYSCSGYPGCKEAVNIPRPTGKAMVEELGLPCPNGDGKMELKFGRKGAFLGCNRYPECKATMPLM